jgi:hypothetical protein
MGRESSGGGRLMDGRGVGYPVPLKNRNVIVNSRWGVALEGKTGRYMGNVQVRKTMKKPQCMLIQFWSHSWA